MFAKQILRSSSALVAGKQSVRNVAKVLANQRNIIALTSVSQRMFANAGSIEKSVSKLSKALEKEIKYENENYS